jgi:hypothetical protein
VENVLDRDEDAKKGRPGGRIGEARLERGGLMAQPVKAPGLRQQRVKSWLARGDQVSGS